MTRQHLAEILGSILFLASLAALGWLMLAM